MHIRDSPKRFLFKNHEAVDSDSLKRRVSYFGYVNPLCRLAYVFRLVSIVTMSYRDAGNV
jgi:hypothetical protein